jgi:hypothetical protein
MMNLAFVFVMRIIYSVRISLLMMSSWSRILILIANLLIKEMIYGDNPLLVVVIGDQFSYRFFRSSGDEGQQGEVLKPWW